MCCSSRNFMKHCLWRFLCLLPRKTSKEFGKVFSGCCLEVKTWLLYIPPNPYLAGHTLQKFQANTHVVLNWDFCEIARFLGVLRPMVLGEKEWIPFSELWNHPSNGKIKWMFVSQSKCFVANGQLTLKNGAPQTNILQKPSKLMLRLKLHFFGGDVRPQSVFKTKRMPPSESFWNGRNATRSHQLMVLK